jgi:hypothetical protein
MLGLIVLDPVAGCRYGEVSDEFSAVATLASRASAMEVEHAIRAAVPTESMPDEEE